MISKPKFQWHREIGVDMKVKDWIEVGGTDTVDAVVLGIPFARASISASGASEFPDAFRRSWEWFTPYYIDEMVDFRAYRVRDLGDVMLHATDVAESHARIEQAMADVQQSYPDALYVTIGGDHSITAPLVRSVAGTGKRVGIIQFDTHLDMRDFTDGRTNGTPICQLVEEGFVSGKHVYNIGLHGFYNAPSLMEAAKKHGIQMITLKALRKQGAAEVIARIWHKLIEEVDAVYVTVDMDVLDIAYAPGVPAATPGGMRSDELFDLLFEVGKYPIGGVDFVCVDPLRDQVMQTVKATTYAFLMLLASRYMHR